MGKLYEEFTDILKKEQGIAVATIVRAPQQIGHKILVYPDKTLHGSTGNAELDTKIIVDAEAAIWSGEARIFSYIVADASSPQAQVFDVFIEGFPPPPELIIVGAGHISIPLTTFAKTLNYRVTVIDARATFATPERFPHADELIVAWPDEILEKRQLYPSTSIAILTHDPKFDEPTLKVVLSQQVGYVGAIGSRNTSKERAERLKKQGLTDDQIQRIHGPIGLDIGAKTPEEIALAIMAQIVAIRHGRKE
ncbi:MAG TPA: XdhC/CoxI family protein [Dictyobacter sp.]|jgi:xanthine dehydrogenase accessory factor|nr:XdhC/CoxI family protein [Dictyobacter sp.]